MRIENVAVFQALGFCERAKGFIQPGREGRMFKPPDDIEVFFLVVIPQIAFGLEIAERIEGHGLASRK